MEVKWQHYRPQQTIMHGFMIHVFNSCTCLLCYFLEYQWLLQMSIEETNTHIRLRNTLLVISLMCAQTSLLKYYRRSTPAGYSLPVPLPDSKTSQFSKSRKYSIFPVLMCVYHVTYIWVGIMCLRNVLGFAILYHWSLSFTNQIFILFIPVAICVVELSISGIEFIINFTNISERHQKGSLKFHQWPSASLPEVVLHSSHSYTHLRTQTIAAFSQSDNDLVLNKEQNTTNHQINTF